MVKIEHQNTNTYLFISIFSYFLYSTTYTHFIKYTQKSNDNAFDIKILMYKNHPSFNVLGNNFILCFYATG